MSGKQTRLKVLKALLQREKKIYIKQASEQLSVCERTVRRDLKELEKIGVAKTFHGGAVSVKPKNFFGKSENKKFLDINFTLFNLGKISTHNDEVTAVYILGSFNIDIVSRVQSLPKAGQTLHTLSTNYYAGGKGANQAVAAANSLASTHFITKIGKDEFGSKARRYLHNTSIKSLTILEDSDKKTGSAIVFVSQEDGQNIIAIDKGANELITEKELDLEFDLISQSKVFLTQLENSLSIARYGLQLARSVQCLTILNPTPYVESVKDLLPYVDILTPNETEASDISGIDIIDLDTTKRAAKAIIEMGVKTVIITLGQRGCLSFDGVSYQYYPQFDAAVVDTSGAGDAFNGALAASLANGKTLDYAIRYASAFASLAVERDGASNQPTYDLAIARLNTRRSERNTSSSVCCSA